MIIGIHNLLYSPKADQVRAFFRDVLQLKTVDAGGGWFIFGLPPAELGIHPLDDEGDQSRCEMYLMCDDLDRTMAELGAKGVEFKGPVHEAGFGRLTAISLPDGSSLGLYQPRHPLAIE